MKKKEPKKKLRVSARPPARPRSDLTAHEAVKDKDKDLCIVGIGASAGGLEAFEQFFTSMPVNGNVAFVLVPHLDPGHASMLPDLLGRFTKMPVVQVKNGMKIAPNSVYVVPPNKELAILHGVLYLSDPVERQALRLPIDLFLRSLAADQGERAVGILLSGNGSDGTLGLRAIKSEYGLVMVQDPNSAKYRGMPKSAIDTGIVDFVLPPAKMPEQLLKYVGHCSGKGVREIPGSGERANVLSPIFLLLRSQTGHDFSYYKKNTICRRIERRMNVHQIPDLTHYIRYLQQNPQEVEMLFRELLIGVTGLFRDPEAFDLLRKKIATELLADLPANSNLRVWVPGCSSGEEVYSLAIILREAMDETGISCKVQIFGTDIDSQAIDTARSGRYPASVTADLSPDRLKRFFVRDGAFVRVRKEIREMALFAVQNVIKDPPFTKLDLICCRNLLIYMDAELQKKLIPLFHYVLKAGGFLLLGSSESIGPHNELFAMVDKKWKLFRRKDTGINGPARLLSVARMPLAEEGRIDAALPLTRPVSIADVAEKALLDKYAPPCVIVNHKGDILYTHGRTGRFLELPSGSASLNVFEMAREGLRLELSATVRKANQQKKSVTVEGLRVKTNGSHEPVNITVRPLRHVDVQLGTLTLIAFHDGDVQKVPRGRKALGAGQTSSKRIAELEQELRFTQESLQTSIEEMETSNEELKSMNEELQSTNEELQSTNEELETSKEEMQSLNEELVTVNSELQGKIEELSQANNDMKNLFDSTHIATIFLDTRLRIKRFTSDAIKIINLISSDIDRPLSHIASNLEQGDLTEDARTVLETLVPKEVVVKTKDQRIFLMRMMPYRTIDNHIDGVVMTFTDIASRMLQAARSLAQDIMETVDQPIVMLDSQMQVIQANHAFYTRFETTPESTVDQVFFDLEKGRWKIPQLQEGLQKLLSENAAGEFEVRQDLPGIGTQTLSIRARRIVHDGVGTDGILLAMENASQHKAETGQRKGKSQADRPV